MIRLYLRSTRPTWLKAHQKPSRHHSEHQNLCDVPRKHPTNGFWARQTIWVPNYYYRKSINYSTFNIQHSLYTSHAIMYCPIAGTTMERPSIGGPSAFASTNLWPVCRPSTMKHHKKCSKTFSAEVSYHKIIVFVFCHCIHYNRFYIFQLCPDIEYPTDDEALSAEAVDAVEQLLTMDPNVRPSYKEVQQMAFFESIDWENIQKTEPPFVPNPENETDTGYFEGKNSHREETFIIRRNDQLLTIV